MFKETVDRLFSKYFHLTYFVYFQYIVDELRKLEWLVELDTFKANTPHNGKLEFTNIIATYNPESRRYLVLACHYDSKLFTEFVFLGATDSAVPCAMLLYLAKSMNYTLRQLNSVNNFI